MNSRIRRTAGLALAIAAVAAPVAQAEPARTFTFAGAGTQSWEATGAGIVLFSDGTVPAEECTPGLRECDDTLVKLDVPGTLTAKSTSGAPTQVDVALDIWESDADGNAVRQLKKGDGSTPTADESVAGDFDPGYYLVRVDFLFGEGPVNVEATFAPLPVEPPAAPTPPVGGADTNAKPTSSIKLARRARRSSLRSISGTAKDDGSVSRVEVAIVQRGKRNKCKQMSARGSFTSTRSCTAPTRFLRARGTSKWSLRLPKRLAKGNYYVFARAIDDKGAVQEKLTRRSLTVR